MSTIGLVLSPLGRPVRPFAPSAVAPVPGAAGRPRPRSLVCLPAPVSLSPERGGERQAGARDRDETAAATTTGDSGATKRRPATGGAAQQGELEDKDETGGQAPTFAHVAA
jgi:hypothetical protein